MTPSEPRGFFPAWLPRLRIPTWFFAHVLAPAVASRLALLLVGQIALTQVVRGSYRAAEDPTHFPWLDVWLRWDAIWYLGIVREGYSFDPREPSNVAFAPLLPMLMKSAGFILRRENDTFWAAAGLAISNLALVTASLLLYRLTRLDLGPSVASKTVLYLLLFPTSLFLSALYPHSLMLAFSIGALYAARTRHWWLAGLLGALAVLSRPYGALLLVPLALEWWQQRRESPPPSTPSLLWLGLIPLAFLGWLGYLYWLTGSPLSGFTIQSQWGRHLSAPWTAFALYFGGPMRVHDDPRSFVDLILSVFLLVASLLSWCYLRPSLAVFATLSILAVISSSTLFGTMRHGLEIFPAFMALACLGERHAWFDRVYLAFAPLLSGAFMVLYAQWYWVA